MNAQSVWIATRKQGGSGGRTHRLGDVEIAEDSALSCEMIEIGCLEAFGTEHTDVRVALVVSENDNYVGQGIRFSSKHWGQAKKENARQDECESRESKQEKLHKRKEMDQLGLLASKTID